VDRCAVFVDAGYVLADGAMAVHGTRQRDSVSWDYAGLVKLLTGLSRDRTGLPVLRCYWYEATVEGRRSSEHNALADLPGVKLRLGRMRPGRREGVEAEMHRDLTALARNHAVSDAVIVSAEEDLAEVVAEVQEFGLRVVIVHIMADGNWTVPRPLRQECDDIVEISGAHLRPFVDLIAGAEPSGQDDQYRNGRYAPRSHERRSISNGHGAGLGAVTHQGLPAAALPAPPGIYTTPVVEEYQRTAQPGQGQGRGPGPAASAAPPPASHAAPQAPAAQPQPLSDQAAAQLPAAAAQPPVTSRDPAGSQAPAGSQDPVGSENPPARQAPHAHQAPHAAQAQAGHQAPPAAQAQAAYQAPAGHQPQGAAQFPAAAQGPASQPLAAPTGAADYGAPPGEHVPAHGNYGPGPGQPGQGADIGQNAPGPPPEAAPAPSPGRRRASASPPPASEGMPQAPVPQTPVPQTPVPQTPVPQTPAPQAPAQQAPMPAPAPLPPQNPVVPQAAMPQPSSPPPGPGETRFGPGQGDYRAPEPGGQRSLPSRETMPAPAPEATRSGRPTAQFADNGVSGRFAENGGPGRFGAGAGPGQYPPAPSAQPGAFGAGSPAQMPYSQFPGPPPGQHAAPAAESGYPAPQHEQDPYSGPQPAVHPNLPQPVSQSMAISLTDAVQAAHAEGFGFGDAVARDAPALWLEAVLARKPRMPSDLEARLLQGSALPIDSLLHDEVRHSLRRGFWDALERSRR
jgi:NYN domain